MVKALTRKEVMEEWNKNDKYHNHYVCPHCRDILCLDSITHALFCGNTVCENHGIYNKDTGVEV